MATHPLEIEADKLHRLCDLKQLDFETTQDLASLAGTVGQPRAGRALDLGLEIPDAGFNIYASGLPGTGKATTIAARVREVAARRPVPNDWCYVFNFADPYRPTAISLPAGKAAELSRDIDQAIEGARREMPRAFESENYEERRNEIAKGVTTKRDELIEQVHKDAAARGLAVQITPIGIVVVPQADGHQMSREEFEALPDDQKAGIRERGNELQAQLTQAFRQVRRLERDAEEQMRQLDREVALFAVGHFIEDLLEKYHEFAAVTSYLSQMQNDIVEHLADFRTSDGEVEGLEKLEREDRFRRYKVNVVVDNSRTTGAPVIVEYNPTYYNLFGRIEFRARLGVLATDLGMIKSGSLLAANGGYLIVQARDLLLSPFVWDTLKRHLRPQQLQIENLGEQFTALPAATIRPEPIPLDVKIIMVGPPQLYYLLYHLEDDFRKLFKIKADYDTSMDRTPEHVREYAELIGTRARESNLKPFHREAVAKLIDYSSRLVEDQAKLSTEFIEVADTLAEASFWATKGGSDVVRAEHVDRAIREREFRANLIEEKIREAVDRGFIVVDTQGAVEAQVNGLAVSTLGDYSFGMPSRITARTSLGSGRFVNIERESRMSGKIHSKGFMILSSYLASKYGQNKPLALSAWITFEQTYDEVDGDSASSTELYALLSSLSGATIKQNLAVTGSVDQRGRVQAVGGVTRKIEGFFAVCKARGLTGDQGVIIPKSNLPNLTLRPEVIDAVRAGQFHVYAVETIDQGIELLTGVPFGQQRADGSYPEGSINALVDRRLQTYADQTRQFAQPARMLPGPVSGPPMPTPAGVGMARPGTRRARQRRLRPL